MKVKPNMHQLGKYLCIILSAAILLTGCATGPTQASLDASKAVFKAGDVKGSLIRFEAAYKGQTPKDTPYYLEKGYVLRLLGSDALSQSSLTLFEADKAVNNWEAQATRDLAKTSANFANYFLAPVKSSAAYELKDFEKSMLSYTLALNHVLAGRPDLAMVEARKMAQREKLIEALHEKKVNAIQEKESRKYARKNMGQESTGFSRIEDVNGYPINVITSPEINALKNAYQSAAAHYLAGYIFESQNEKGLAAAGYRLAAELKPGVGLFRKSLGNLDSPKHNKSNADTLIIVETGYVPRIYSEKINQVFPTFSGGVRLVTIRLPAIEAYQSLFHLNNIRVEGEEIEVIQAANLDTMVRRQLKDEMPGYVLKATTQAITQLIAQEATKQAARHAAKSGHGNNNNALAAFMIGEIAAISVGAAMSVGDVDVRAWTTLPSAIYIARKPLKKGEKKITLLTPVGSIDAKVNLKNDYELIYARVLGNGAVVLTQAAPGDIPSYLKPQTANTTKGSIKAVEPTSKPKAIEASGRLEKSQALESESVAEPKATETSSTLENHSAVEVEAEPKVVETSGPPRKNWWQR